MSPETVQYVIILLVVLLFSMAFHEMMHGFAADWLGDDTARLQGRLTLNPLAHIDPFLTVAVPLLLLISGAPPFGAAKPVQVNFSRLRYGEFGGAIVGVIGPLTNLVIALVASLLFKNLHSFGGLAYQVLGMTILINVGFFLFNIIPWPPLDGSRLLYAFAPRPLQEVMENIERTGQIISLVIIMFIFYTFLSGPFSHIFSIFMDHLAPGFLQFLSL